MLKELSILGGTQAQPTVYRVFAFLGKSGLLINMMMPSTAFPNCDTAGTWAQLYARIERYKSIVKYETSQVDETWDR